MGVSRGKGRGNNRSLGEAQFIKCWEFCGDKRKYVEEHRFHPERRFRFDFAFLGERVAVEIEGGSWSGGRHVRGAGFEKDCEKYNLAGSMGWRVLRFTTGMITTDPGGSAQRIIEALDS